MNAMSPLEYYREQSPMSNPGELGRLFVDLPSDVPSMVKTVQQCLVHVFWAGAYGLELDEARKGEVGIRPVKHKLARLLELDNRPMSEARPPEQRLVGNCRDFTLTIVSMLRAKGIPARSRCGFGTYFIPNHYEDHWVAEYWNSEQGRWVMVDAQLDAVQQEALKLSFDPLDMPKGQFVTGGEAWLMARRGEADPNSFGIFDMKGMDFIEGDLLRDLLALNKFEVLPWDGWGILERPFETRTPAEMEMLDHTAALTLTEDLDAIRALYQSTPDFQAPNEWSD